MTTDYRAKSPVLFIIFNRPDTTLQVFNQIRAAKPPRLYIAADGARKGHATDAERSEAARAVATQVDWECEVKTLFRENNLGCKYAVSSAIDWFFEHEEEGIILEDDCLPATSFFRYCDTLLARYRHDTRINNITGTNLQQGKIWGDDTYYFSNYSNIWGWASWRRVWQKYSVSLSQYNEADAEQQLKKVFTDKFLAADWFKIFKEVKAGKIDTWDYQLTFMTFFENAMCITPNINQITNIGFRPDATHTPDPNNHNANLPVSEIGEITHPHYFLPEKEADYFILRKDFDLDIRWKRYHKLKNRFRRWLKEKF